MKKIWLFLIVCAALSAQDETPKVDSELASKFFAALQALTESQLQVNEKMFPSRLEVETLFKLINSNCGKDWKAVHDKENRRLVCISNPPLPVLKPTVPFTKEELKKRDDDSLRKDCAEKEGFKIQEDTKGILSCVDKR